jgi:hypothetical protein
VLGERPLPLLLYATRRVALHLLLSRLRGTGRRLFIEPMNFDLDMLANTYLRHAGEHSDEDFWAWEEVDRIVRSGDVDIVPGTSRCCCLTKQKRTQHSAALPQGLWKTSSRATGIEHWSVWSKLATRTLGCNLR